MKILRRIVVIIWITLCVTTSAFSQFSEFESQDFQKADSIADIYANYDLRNQKQLVELLTKYLDSEIKKFRAIFKWITNNISYDIELYTESIDKNFKLLHDKKKLDAWRKRFSKRLMK